MIDSKVFIDATGNATIASASGADVYEKNSSYGCLMRVGGVDISKTIEHIEKTKQWNYIEGYNQWLEEVLANRKYRATGAVLKDPVSYDHAPMLSKDDHFMNDEKWNYIKERWEKFRFIYTLEVSLFRNELKKAVESGDFNFEIYHDDKSGVTMNGDGISYGSWGQNVALINVAKAFGFNPKYMEDESHANILSRKYNLTFLSFLKKYVPGFENSFILDQGTRATNRSCRHIDNSSMMDEILDFPMYTFKTMYSYQTPKEITYKSIVGGKLNNLFVIGKGAYQSESFRSQISCMLMGISSAAAAKTIIEDKSNTLNINRDLFKSNLDILFTWE
ncbi:TPA: FAD-dependent oxidoreductase, partial [Streptococcus pneumoniae]